MKSRNEDLDEKASWYYATANMLAALTTLFGIVPAVMGFMSNELELCYQGLNFFVVSFALMMALRSGYFLSDRSLKKGWNHWLKRNEDKIKKTDRITVYIMTLTVVYLFYRDFYGINDGLIPIIKDVLTVFKFPIGM